MIRIELPVPPSINNAYCNRKGRVAADTHLRLTESGKRLPDGPWLRLNLAK